MFGSPIRGRKKRLVELAGMFKEVGKGNIIKLHEIAAKFAAKSGLRLETVSEYVELFMQAKLLMVKHGQETWEYNEQVEVEIFGTKL